jgi:hypothetical protein
MARLLFGGSVLSRRGRAGLVLASALLASGLSPAVAVARDAGPSLDRLICVIPAVAVQERPATELRVALGRLLGEHAYLLMETMRSQAAEAPDLDAVRARLDANSQAIGAALADIYGAAAQTAFLPLWQRHIDAAGLYAAAVASQDDAAADEAEAVLEAFRADLDAFLQTANPNLDAADEAHAIRLHLDQLTAFARGDYAAGYRAAREAYAHMYGLGDTLARAIAQQDPERFPDERIAFSPASELRIRLDGLLGEHLVLAAEAMRASLDEAPNLAAANQALEANTADLAAAVEQVYGPEAGSAFQELWTAHLTAYLDYIDAVRTEDQARIDAAQDTLEAYGQVFGEFIAGANPELAAEDVADLIAHHTMALLEMVDEYRTGDYDAAYATVGEAYGHMFTVGDALAAAIAAQFPEDYDDLEELPPTDGLPGPGGFDLGALARFLVLAVAAVAGWRLWRMAPILQRREARRRARSERTDRRW